VAQKAGKLLLSFFGLGYLPRMPGTWGSAGAAIIYLGLALAGLPMLPVCLGLAVVFTVLTIALGGWAEETYGRKDPSQVVTDEVAGYFVSSAFLVDVRPPTAAVLAFFLFRFFDIVKPPPARQIEKLPRGWGLTLDDIAAGIFACAVGHAVVLWVIPQLPIGLESGRGPAARQPISQQA
jgi:phosphatidylglycerophosphatase A